MQDASMLTIECPQCEEKFIPGHTRKQYCSPTCRQQAYRDRNQVKASPPPTASATDRPKPDPRVEPTRVTNPDWLAQYQRCSTEQQRYRVLTIQLEDLERQVTGMTEGRAAGNTGRLIGFSLAVIVIAMVYDSRKSKPINATVLVILAALAVGLTFAGYHIGCLFGKQRLAADLPAQEKLTELQKLIAESQQLLLQQQELLNTANAGLATISQYESETSIHQVKSDTNQSVSLNDEGASDDHRDDGHDGIQSSEGILHHEEV